MDNQSMTCQIVLRPTGQRTMNQNLRYEIEESAREFLHTAREYVSNIVGDTEALRRQFGDSRIEIGGPLFGMDDQVREKQDDLVESCVRFLGVELGNEEEIEELAWKHVWASFQDSIPLLDVSQNARQFADQVSRYQQRSYGYIAPNHVLKFTGQAERIVIGPVEAMKTEHLVASQKEVSKDKTIWERMLASSCP